VHLKDNLYNTGLWKGMACEIMMSFVMNYPTFYGKVYYEEADDLDWGMPFSNNDLLLCMMLFFRFHFMIRTVLSFSFYTDPRA
jgi:hypothetical protein